MILFCLDIYPEVGVLDGSIIFNFSWNLTVSQWPHHEVAFMCYPRRLSDQSLFTVVGVPARLCDGKQYDSRSFAFLFVK